MSRTDGQQKAGREMESGGDFVFESYAFDRVAGVLSLTYSFADGPRFTEKITFPLPLRALSPVEEKALDSAFRLVFLLSGVSYYKARVPHTLTCRAFALAPALAAFVEKVYRHGLGEFAWKNGLDLSDRVRLVAATEDGDTPFVPQNLSLPRRTCVPVGGGKDSIVTIETMKRAGEPLLLFASGTAEPIARTIAMADLPAVRVVRTLDPLLMQMNAAGALNGHVPVTAILSAIAVACAILYGFDTIALSNESSASEPNTIHHGIEINHQYSKSLDFERDFARIVRESISPDITYFSFLRPLTEAAITRRFAPLERYHAIFRSCNTAFRLTESARLTHWCCACPKCRFVFLALAPFVPRAHLTRLFGQDLLDDETQTDGYAALAGLSDIKPFECVGTVRESALLLGKVAGMPAWREASVLTALSSRLPLFDPSAFDALFRLQADHAVPPRFLEMLDHGPL